MKILLIGLLTFIVPYITITVFIALGDLDQIPSMALMALNLIVSSLILWTVHKKHFTFDGSLLFGFTVAAIIRTISLMEFSFVLYGLYVMILYYFYKGGKEWEEN